MHLRAFAKNDVPQVAELYRRVHGTTGRPTGEALASYITELFFNNPWSDDSLPSLVVENERGGVGGFLGVIPRRMSFNGRRIRVAVSTSYMVDPETRPAGLLLLKKFLSGPQDLSMTDAANDASRAVWEAVGGTTVQLYSIYWTRLLRPSGYALHSLRQRRRVPSPLYWILRRATSLADALTVRFPPLRQAEPKILGEPLTTEGLLDCLSRWSATKPLQPDYDYGFLKWLLDMAAQKQTFGPLQAVLLRNARREVLGWYLYYRNAGGISQVLQLAATKDSLYQVLEHLFYDAWRHGSLAIYGRLEPQFMQELWDEYCLFNPGGWMLIDSGDPELREAIYRGRAFLTRLEGEWWTRCLELI